MRASPCIVAAALVLLASFATLAAELSPPVRLTVGRNVDGRLQIFWVGPDGQLFHRWQKNADGVWSARVNLGGSFLPGAAVANQADGRLIIFAVNRASNGLHYAVQKEVNGHDWSEWKDFGGKIHAPVSVGKNQDGRLEVFAVGLKDGGVDYFWQESPNGEWSNWESLGGSLEGPLTVIRDQAGCLQIFGVDAARKSVVQRQQTEANGANGWSAWQNLGGELQPGLVVGQNLDGRLEMFGVSRRNKRVARAYQSSQDGAMVWSTWASFGPYAFPGLAMGQNADGRLELFAIGWKGTNLLHCWQKEANGVNGWSEWGDMGGYAQSHPGLGQNWDGNLEVFTADPIEPAKIQHRRQISGNRDWLDWRSLDRQEFAYTPRIWQTDEGLPHGVVQSLAQTADGYLWVGTQNGLARFDGVRLTVFDSKNTPQLKNNFITSLCVDGEGRLWIGTQGGLAWLKDGVFTRCDTNSTGLAGEFVNVIYRGKNQAMWVGTLTGLSRQQGGKFTNFREENGLMANNIRAIYEDNDGSVWIGTSMGLNRLREGKMEGFNKENGLPDNSIRGIFQDRGGRLWIGSAKGMIWFNTERFHAYDKKYGLSDSFVSSVCEDRSGNFWVGTYSGLNRFREGRFYNELNREGVAYDKVNALLEDREGNIWVGSKDGLIRLVPKRFIAYNKRQGLSHNNTLSVLEDHNGAIWTATYGGGINCLKDERVTVYLKTNGLADDLLLSLATSRDGSLWIGADVVSGLTRFKDGKFTRYDGKDGLIGSAIRVLHEDQEGNLWIGTRRGLSRLRDGQFTSFTTTNNLAADTIQAICEDAEGTLWFGTKRGLSRWENGSFVNLTAKDGLSDNSVTALYADSDQNLWMGTESGGLNRLKDGKVRHYTTAQGLFSDEIFAVLEDDYGWLWMSCSKGIFRVRKSDFDALDAGRRQSVGSVVYGKSDGMETTLCNGIGKPAAWKAQDGRLWFATTKGLVVVSPDIPVNETTPEVFIEQVNASGNPLPGLVASKPDARSLTAPAGTEELEFHFTAMNLHKADEIRFRYKLEGADTEWHDAGNRRSVHYNNISPGQYHFRVIARNADGVWNETGASVPLEVLPHFWQTWWFRGCVVLAALGFVGGATRYVTRSRMQRKLEQLEQQHAIERERGRIAKDIHDDLGSSLTRIMMLGERVQEDSTTGADIGNHVRKIVDSARSTVQSMDEIVWAINPENDTLDGMAGYLSQYATQFFDGTPLRCRLEMPTDLPPSAVPAELRHDLFLVFKEALNNVVKHSSASEVRIEFVARENEITLVIEDNGCGFDRENRGARGRNGLANMQKRIEALGGAMDLSTTVGSGTRLTFTVPIPTRVVQP